MDTEESAEADVDECRYATNAPRVSLASGSWVTCETAVAVTGSATVAEGADASHLDSAGSIRQHSLRSISRRCKQCVRSGKWSGQRKARTRAGHRASHGKGRGRMHVSRAEPRCTCHLNRISKSMGQLGWS